jgi:hypothetical protein
MLSGEDLTATIGALCFWADRGDEQAALDLNELVRRQSPEVMLAARAIQANALFQSRCAEWEMLAATVDLIAPIIGSWCSMCGAPSLSLNGSCWPIVAALA